MMILGVSFGLLALAGVAQQPKDKPSRKEDQPSSPRAADFVARMMAFDKNKDGKLTRDEITDERLLRLFDRADANNDGVVTKQELTALARRMAQDGPPGGLGRFQPPQPGQLFPPFLQETLKMNDEQKKQVAELQKEVDEKLAQILTAEQKKQLQDMRSIFSRRGPGGRRPQDPPPGKDKDKDKDRP
jgi:hypothetical protein